MDLPFDGAISRYFTEKAPKEVRKIIDSNYRLASGILTANMDKLHAMSGALLKFETIDETQIRDIMAGREPRPPEGWDSSGGPGAPATVSGGALKGDEPGLGEPATQHRTRG